MGHPNGKRAKMFQRVREGRNCRRDIEYSTIYLANKALRETKSSEFIHNMLNDEVFI